MFMNRGLLAAIYSLSIVLGLLTLFFPAESIEGVIGLLFAYTYGGLLILGAVGCLVGVIIPNFKIELVFLWLVAGGYLVYDIALWALFGSRIGVEDGLPPPYGPAIGIAVLTLFLFGKIAVLDKKKNQLVRAADHDRLD